jgi:hypothetical protein
MACGAIAAIMYEASSSPGADGVATSLQFQRGVQLAS